jgi:hypothetical protein
MSTLQADAHETDPAVRRERSRSGAFAGLLLGIITGAALMLGLARFAARESQPDLWDRVVAKLTGHPVPVSPDLPAVIAGIQHLSRLETVVYTMDKVVEGERQSEYLPDFLAGDKILLVVHGQVTAGVDLGTLQPSRIQVQGRSVRLHLPDAQVFTAALDDQQTRVYSRTTGLLVSADPNLETEIRARAQQQIRDAALAGGILGTAESNARSTVTTLLRSLGFDQIQFQ